jgi:type I restriction enzyme S subunit
MWQGRCVHCDIEGIVSPAYTVCKPKEGIDPLFHYYLFKTNQMIGIFHQHSQGLVNDTLNLKYEAFSKIKYLVPSLPEQQKIAECLRSVDDLIQAEADQLQALKDHKKGLMQQLFPQEGETTPKLRFPGFNGEWEEKKLGDVFKRITRKNKENNKNVLTISAQYGLVSQIDFFNKSVAAADVTGYYLLEKGDFAYNKSSSSGNPVGVIKPLKMYDKGVVSTLYICFRCNNPASISFWEQYFNAGCLDAEIRTIAQEGARNHGLLNVPTSDFFTLTIIAPSLPEQQKIAECLSSLDEGIAAQQRKVEALKEHKKGLMQKLFPTIN